MKLNNMACRREFLEQIPTKELDEMLQAELRKEKLDDDLVRLILDVLEAREAGHPVENNEEITAAVEKYTTYLDSLEAAPQKTAKKWSTVLKVASILIVMGLLVFVVPQTANAESFFDLLARWTNSVFEFFDPSEPNDQPEYVFETDHPGLQELYDAVVELGVTDPVVPMWVPREYAMDEIKVIEQPSELALCASMKSQDNKIYFLMFMQSKHSSRSYMKDSENIEEFELYGVKHYILSNNEQMSVIWTYNNIECSIVVDCQEDIYRILESIYTTEVQ